MGYEDIKKYNWVDVKDFASNVFYNCSYELPWAEDAWNILMFSNVVKANNVAQCNHGEQDKGDMIIWLLTLYDVLFDYKSLIGDEEAYFDHDIGMSDYKTYEGKDLVEVMGYIDDGEKLVSCYLKNEIYELLNKRLMDGSIGKCEFYDIEEEHFVFSHDSCLYYSGNSDEDYEEGGNSVAHDILNKNIIKRRKIFTDSVYEYFNHYGDSLNGYYDKIFNFMIGQHWCDNYFNYEMKKRKIEREYSNKIEILNKVDKGITLTGREKDKIGDNDKKHIEMEYEDKLNELEYSLPLSLEHDGDASASKVYGWIEGEMYRI